MSCGYSFKILSKPRVPNWRTYSFPSHQHTSAMKETAQKCYSQPRPRKIKLNRCSVSGSKVKIRCILPFLVVSAGAQLDNHNFILWCQLNVGCGCACVGFWERRDEKPQKMWELGSNYTHTHCVLYCVILLTAFVFGCYDCHICQDQSLVDGSVVPATCYLFVETNYIPRDITQQQPNWKEQFR